MSAGDDRHSAGAGPVQDRRYRRLVYALLLANVVAGVALLVQLTVLRDEEPMGSASGAGALTAPSGDLDTPSGDPAQPTGAGDVAPTTAGRGPEFLTPPERFLPVDDARARTGPLGLDEVTQIDASDPDAARARFVELGFTGGRSRAWQSPTDALLVVAYEFADERGAATYVGEATALRVADPAAAPLPLPGVPEASAFQLRVPGDPTQVAFLARGTTAYVVGLVGPAADDPTASLLHELAALQYDAAL